MNKPKKPYRVHITCPVGHMTYQDFARLYDAKKCLERMQDKTDWHAIKIEKIEWETCVPITNKGTPWEGINELR